MGTVSNISMYVTPGDTYKIKIPVLSDLGAGFHYREEDVKYKGEPKSLIKGFFVENEEVGTIHPNYPDELAVDYRHLLPGENTIWFYASTGEIIKFYVAFTTVHDHASIVTGGPAFGTYYSPPIAPTEGE